MKKAIVCMVMLVAEAVWAVPKGAESMAARGGADLCKLLYPNGNRVSSADVRAVLEMGGNPNAICDHGSFITLVEDPVIISMLMQHGGRPSAENLRFAIFHLDWKYPVDRVEYMKQLIKSGARLEKDALVLDDLYWEPEVIRLALQAGADPNAHATHGWNPLFAAVQSDNVGAAIVLLKAGANPNSIVHWEDGRAETLLQRAAKSPRMITLLKKYGAKE